ncbi:MAG: insulinase family protein [Candidatus Aminicenantes bacterium]|nr:insulinase family protein [Candidatus Aminicenantes bacterium]
MVNKAGALVSLALILLGGPGLAAQDEAGAPESLPFSFETYMLRNGLRIILSEDPRLPLVTVAVGYGAGTLREKPGQEGLAFLLENLMFQGSENVPPLQHVAYVQKVGGELNATTSADKALFYETLPSNQLSLALWLESDRMKSLAITPLAIEQTQDDLLREHRERVATDPYFETFIQFEELLFPDPSYGHPMIGPGMDDLSEAEILAFHRAHYVPNNAVLCIVGNIDVARTRGLVARYFESIAPGPDVPPLPGPEFTRESDAVVRSAQVSGGSAGFHMGFRFFPLQPGDRECLRILAYVLFEGETSRLNHRLLRRDLTARYVTGSLDERPGVSALKIFCFATNAIMVARSERAILSEIDRLKANEVSPDELRRARRRFRKDYLDRLATNLGKARFLVEAAFAGTGLDALDRDLGTVLAVTPQNLAAFASKYFVPQNRVVLEFGPR